VLYVTLRGHWCDVILNLHATTEDKSDDMKDALTRNYSVYSVGSQSTTWKFYYHISKQKYGEKIL